MSDARIVAASPSRGRERGGSAALAWGASRRLPHLSGDEFDARSVALFARLRRVLAGGAPPGRAGADRAAAGP
jgi:hypothetical protein